MSQCGVPDRLIPTGIASSTGCSGRNVAIDNPALDVAVDAANLLGKPVVVFLAPVPFYPNANLRHYHFLAEGIPDIAAALARKKCWIRVAPLS